MQTNEFNQAVSSSVLNENMFKKFGVKVNFTKYTREQLEDARNHLRTKLSQTESNAGFNDLLANEDYQQDKYMLNLLNTKIKEMLGERKLTKAEKAKKERVVKKDLKPKKKEFEKRYGKDKGEQVMYAVATNIAKGKKMNKKTNEAKKAKPDYLDFDGDGNKKEPMKKALKDKAKAKKKNPFAKKKTSSKKVKDVNEMYYYDTKKGGRSVPPSDKLGRRPEKHGVIDDPEGYKGVVKGKNKHGKFPSRLRQMYSLNGPKGTLPEEMSEAAKPKCCCKTKSKAKCPVHGKKKVKESLTSRYYRTVTESIRYLLSESEEAKAKDISQAADMVEELTRMMNQLAKMQTNSLITLHDSIRQDIGEAEANAFKDATQPALEQALQILTQGRETVSRAVQSLATGEMTTPMGGDTTGMNDMGGLDNISATPDDSMNMSGEDEFGASDAAAGGAETAGREMRESRVHARARKLAEAHSIISRLAK